MPAAKPITEHELEAIKLSVEIARQVTLDDRIGAFRVYRCAAHDASIPKWKVDQDVLLARLRWLETRNQINWSHPHIRGVILNALDRNDHKFMTQLGRALSRPPKRLHAANTQAEKLKQFLLAHWAEPKDGWPELFYLTKEDTADICTQHLEFTVDDSTIKQLCHRFRLKSFRYKLYKLRWSRDRMRIIGVDKI